MNILIADEMDLVTSGARAALEQPNWIVRDTVHTLSDLLRTLKILSSDLIICGETLEPGMDPLALLTRLQSNAPHTVIVFIGGALEGHLIRELLDAGLAGYLHRADVLSSCLPNAVRTVMRGIPYLSPTANSAYLVATQSGTEALDTDALTVLRLLAAGWTVAGIAAHIGGGRRRVYRLRNRLRQRFGATTNEHLIRCAVAEGYLPAAE